MVINRVWSAACLGLQLFAGTDEAAITYARSHGGTSLLVWEKGALRTVWHREPAMATQARHVMSGAKNFFALACLQAVEAGWLDLDERASETLVEWKADPRKASICVRDLLSCSSGLDPATAALQGVRCPDKYRTATQVEALHPHGSNFAYGPSHFLALAELMRRKLEGRGDRLPAFLERSLLKPFGIPLEAWRRDGAGNLIPYAGLNLRPDEWLDFGRMLLEGGQHGQIRLISKDSLVETIRPSKRNPAYGLTFWLNASSRQKGAVEADVERWISRKDADWSRACLSRHAPADLFACIGSGGQRLYIIPSRQMVVVHMGACADFVDGAFLRCLFP